MVQQGDTLFAIARKSSVTIDALKQANNLASEKIVPGQSLIIPAK